MIFQIIFKRTSSKNFKFFILFQKGKNTVTSFTNSTVSLTLLLPQFHNYDDLFMPIILREVSVA